MNFSISKCMILNVCTFECMIFWLLGIIIYTVDNIKRTLPSLLLYLIYSIPSGVTGNQTESDSDLVEKRILNQIEEEKKRCVEISVINYLPSLTKIYLKIFFLHYVDFILFTVIMLGFVFIDTKSHLDV